VTTRPAPRAPVRVKCGPCARDPSLFSDDKRVSPFRHPSVMCR
jgi:hypothetical protein